MNCNKTIKGVEYKGNLRWIVKSWIKKGFYFGHKKKKRVQKAEKDMYTDANCD